MHHAHLLNLRPPNRRMTGMTELLPDIYEADGSLPQDRTRQIITRQIKIRQCTTRQQQRCQQQ